MFGKWLFALMAPLALAVTLSACTDGGVQPGIQAAPAGGFRGEAGRVVAIRDVDLRDTRTGVTTAPRSAAVVAAWAARSLAPRSAAMRVAPCSAACWAPWAARLLAPRSTVT